MTGPDHQVHAAKLPCTLPPERLLHRPPDGVTTSIDPADAGWRYLSFRSVALAAGETVALPHAEREAVVVTIRGGAEIVVGGSPAIVLEGRATPFSGLPWAAYLPPRGAAAVRGRPWTAGDRSVVAIGQAPPSGRPVPVTSPVLIRPTDMAIEVRGRGPATRQVTTIVAPDFPADRLLACEAHIPAGNWSGWPAHKHDVDDMPREAVLEETYFYQFRPVSGAFGVAGMYFRDGRPERWYAVRHGDLLAIVDGYHPFAATPGYDAYFLNFLAGDRRTMAASDDPQTSWIRATWETVEADPRVPVVTHAEPVPR
jgi:5-deoxy-glucuronate isomerase